MSKQQAYQSLNTEMPNGEDYGFAERLPQAGGSQLTDCTRDADLKGSEGVGVTYPMAYPVAAQAGAPVAGYPAMPMSYPAMPMSYPAMPMSYPAMPMSGPVGMVVQDPLGMCGRNACAANGCRGCRGCRGCHGCHGCQRRRGGLVHLVFRLARSAYHSAQNHHRKQAPALKPTSAVLSN